MGSFSIWHWLIVLVVVLILFGGRGKISQLMGDLGKGLNSFKKSMREDETFEEKDFSARESRALPHDAPRAPETVTGPDRASPRAPDQPTDLAAERDPVTRP